MKRRTLFICILLSTILSIAAGPLPYDLESDFDLDYLLENNFNVEMDDTLDMLVVTPPDDHYAYRDEIITCFTFPYLDEIDSWIAVIAMVDENTDYEDAYSYIADVMGEGVSDKNTRFQIERYSREPSEEKIMSLLLSGELGSYIAKIIPPMIITSELTDDDIENVNMWSDDDYIIYTLSSYGQTKILYVNKGYMTEMINSLLGMAFLEAFADL